MERCSGFHPTLLEFARISGVFKPASSPPFPFLPNPTLGKNHVASPLISFSYPSVVCLPRPNCSLGLLFSPSLIVLNPSPFFFAILVFHSKYSLSLHIPSSHLRLSTCHVCCLCIVRFRGSSQHSIHSSKVIHLRSHETHYPHRLASSWYRLPHIFYAHTSSTLHMYPFFLFLSSPFCSFVSIGLGFHVIARVGMNACIFSPWN